MATTDEYARAARRKRRMDARKEACKRVQTAWAHLLSDRQYIRSHQFGHDGTNSTGDRHLITYALISAIDMYKPLALFVAGYIEDLYYICLQLTYSSVRKVGRMDEQYVCNANMSLYAYDHSTSCWMGAPKEALTQQMKNECAQNPMWIDRMTYAYGNPCSVVIYASRSKTIKSKKNPRIWEWRPSVYHTTLPLLDFSTSNS
jgi:hypothetical protein